MSEFQKESLTLEETNKLRISLGLKPLTEDAPSESKPPADDDGSKPVRQVDEDAEIERRHVEQLERNRREKEERETRERIAKAQNRRELARKLQGPTLADPEPADAASGGSSSHDTLRWLKQAKKRAKENAAKRAKELEEQEAQAQAEYGEADLAGLKVAHSIEDFGDGDEHILTLRDSKVLDDAEDELMDYNLEQAERDRINQERKRARKGYTGLDDEEFGDETVGRKRGVLSKYDADIAEDDGLTRIDAGGFRLGAGAAAQPNRKEQARKELEQEAAAANKRLLSLDYAKNQEVSDYLQEGDVGFKKPKTKKRKKAARVKLDLDDADEAQPSTSASTSADVAMQDGEPEEPAIRVRKPRARETDNFVDDDELQASLAKARRQKAKRTFTKMTPEMIAKNLAAQRAAEEAERAASGSPYPGEASTGADATVKQEEEGGSGLTFDNTSEFVRAIGHRQAAEQEEEENRRRRRLAAAAAATSAIATSATDGTVKRESASAEPEAAQHGAAASPPCAASVDGIRVKKEEDDDDGNVEFADPEEEYEAARMAAEGILEPGADTEGGELGGIVPSVEPTNTMGVAGTLALLRNQGMLPTVSAEEKARERQQREYDRWLAQRRAEEQLRELERKMSKAQGSAKDQATREYENRKRELDEARSAADRFRDYKPDVEIAYHDEFGRTLNAREAWKQLSHVFHGKKPGAKKQEKRLKRIEDEKKRERMAAGDTPTGMLEAFQKRAERTGQAHMVLSVGSRGGAPSDAELLGPNLLSANLLGGTGDGGAGGKGGGNKGKRREGSATAMGLGDGSRATSATVLDDASERGSESVLSSSAAAFGAAGGGAGAGVHGEAFGGSTPAGTRKGWTAVGARSVAPSGTGVGKGTDATATTTTTTTRFSGVDGTRSGPGTGAGARGTGNDGVPFRLQLGATANGSGDISGGGNSSGGGSTLKRKTQHDVAGGLS
ncbi:hypothetical protein ACQY0O_003251 [Thecaphora frezii]